MFFSPFNLFFLFIYFCFSLQQNITFFNRRHKILETYLGIVNRCPQYCPDIGRQQLYSCEKAHQPQ